MAESVKIPEPPGLPFIGNLGEFSANPLNDLIRLGKTYGMATAPLYMCLANQPRRNLQTEVRLKASNIHDNTGSC